MKKGFTLIELLVVIAIIGLLSTVVLASLSSARESAIKKKFGAEIIELRNALQLYAEDNNGLFPVGADGVAYWAEWTPLLVPNYLPNNIDLPDFIDGTRVVILDSRYSSPSTHVCNGSTVASGGVEIIIDTNQTPGIVDELGLYTLASTITTWDGEPCLIVN